MQRSDMNWSQHQRRFRRRSEIQKRADDLSECGGEMGNKYISGS